MFQNNLQSTSYFELFNPNLPAQKTKNIFRLQRVTDNYKMHDKEVKSNIFSFTHRNSQIVFPKNEETDLSLTQRYLNIQIFFFAGMSWSVELGISDQSRIKRRVMFSSAIKSPQKKSFFIKYPCGIQQNCWNNFIIDLYSFIKAFPNQQFHSLDSIHITGALKLRKIFTTHNIIKFSSEQTKQDYIPKNFYFPDELKHSVYFIDFNQAALGQKLQQSEVSTRNESLHKIKQSKSKLPQLESKFLYKSKEVMNQRYKQLQNMQNQLKNQNNSLLKISDEILNKSAKLRSLRTICKLKSPKLSHEIQKRPVSHKKNYKKRELKGPLKQLINKQEKYNEIHSSRTANTIPTKEQKSKIFNTMQNEIQSAHPYLDFKHDSDSEYLEKSSKFSSFFQSRPLTRNETPYNKDSNFNDYIEQDIELEDSLNLKEELEEINKNAPKIIITKRSRGQNYPINQEYLNESSFQEKKNKMNSNEGFGQKLINKYMTELERPYSPPMIDYNDDEQEEGEESMNILQVMYDPILECYYDCKTETYYKLKE